MYPNWTETRNIYQKEICPYTHIVSFQIVNNYTWW